MPRQKISPRLIIGTLIFFLSLSLIGNYLLYTLGSDYYRQLNAIRLDPIGLAAFASTAELITSENDRTSTLVFVGDSRIAQWPLPHLPDYQLYNRGIGGQTSAQVQQRYAIHVATMTPEIVVLQVGINDLKTIPLFPTRRAEIVTALQANIQEITQQALAQESIVILTTIFPTRPASLIRRPFWSAEVDHAIQEVNAYIGSLQAENVIIFDAYAILVNEDGKIYPEYSHDFLHLNTTGYEVLNQELVRLLEDLSLE